MQFPSCLVKSVKADIANGKLTISFSLPLNDETMREAETLGSYMDKHQGEVDLLITPQQVPLFTVQKIGMTPAEYHVVDRETGEILDAPGSGDNGGQQ